MAWQESVMGLYCLQRLAWGALLCGDPQPFFLGPRLMDDLDIRRRRALYRANHRGTKELDLMLGRYADVHVPNMDDAALVRFEQLMALPEPDIDFWLRKGGAPHGVAATVSDVRKFLGLEA